MTNHLLPTEAVLDSRIRHLNERRKASSGGHHAEVIQNKITDVRKLRLALYQNPLTRFEQQITTAGMDIHV